jgi:hypothetical protein
MMTSKGMMSSKSAKPSSAEWLSRLRALFGYSIQ